MRWLLTLTLTLLLVTPAWAITITHGNIMAGVTSDFHPAFNIRSDGVPDTGLLPGLSQRFFVADAEFELVHFSTASLPLQPQFAFAQALVVGTVDVNLSGTTQINSFFVPGQNLTGALTFDIAPLTWADGAMAPFAMTGAINGVPLDGIGTFTLDLGPQRPAASAQNVRFDFAPVPEPATLFLVGSGLVAAGVWRRRRQQTRPR